MSCVIPEVACIHDAGFAAHVQTLLDEKTKPVGSLGVLEQLAHRIACILGTDQPVLQQPQMVVFAADHGLAARGVSAYPVDVTWQMVENFMAGGAAVSVLARQHGVALNVVDCGVARDFAVREQDPHDKLPKAGQPRLWRRKVAYGTQDCSQGPAMTAQECALAIRNGVELVKQLPGNALLLGEMGIGNTSTASVLLSRLCGIPVAQVTGMGTGLNAEGVQRKIAVLEAVLAQACGCDQTAASAGRHGRAGSCHHGRRCAAGRGRAPRDCGRWLYHHIGRAGGQPPAASRAAALCLCPPLGRTRT